MVWRELYEQANYNLKNNKNVILDNTAISYKQRKKTLSNIKVDCYRVCFVMNTPYEECVTRLIARNNSDYEIKIPLSALEMYHKIYQVPFYEEGFDEIILANTLEINSDVYKNTRKMMNIDQNNIYHTLSLIDHSDKVEENLMKYFEDKDMLDPETMNLIVGTRLHDIGKLFTKVPNKKDPSKSSYYNHAEVGAYWKLCNGWTAEEVFYENFHMLLSDTKEGEINTKWFKILGETKYRNLEILKKADRSAH